jgi:hypothetical protein
MQLSPFAPEKSIQLTVLFSLLGSFKLVGTTEILYVDL